MSGPTTAQITVAQALELPELRRGLPEVLAGAGHLDRRLRWVHAGEVHNIASLLRGGELLLTTGMGVGDGAAAQRRFVAELSERGIAAVAFELGTTYTDDLPPALVAEADARGLPLIALRAPVPFVEVTEAIHTAIINGHHEVLRRADELHGRFTTLMLEGGGVPGVLSLLAAAVANPVVLEAADGRLRYFAAPPQVPAELDPVAAWAAARGREPEGTAVTVPGPDGGRLVAVPVLARADELTRAALERAAGIIALAFLRSRQEDELAALGRGDLLARVVDGRLEPAAAAARARAMGFTGDGLLLPLVAHAAGGGWREALRDVEREVAALGVPVLVGLEPATGDLLVVLGLREAGRRAALADRLAERLLSVTRRRSAPPAVVAAGRCGTWEDIGDGLRDAAEAVAPAARLPARPWHDAAAMPLERLLWRLGGQEDLRRYVDRVLGGLLEHDARQRHPLLPTLEALCAAGGRRAETARALHLNRQALYDRLGRLERVLGADLADPRRLLALHLALEARRHLR